MADRMTAGRYQSYTQAVADAKAGVQEAFTYLYERTYRDKWYIAQKYMRNGMDAQDVLQDAYLKAWQNLSRLQDPERFPGWLSMIVGSTALDALRKKRELPFSAMETYADEDDAFAFEEEDWRTAYLPEHAYTEKETTVLLKELLDALSEEQRFCMLMYYVEEHSVSEIAEVIGCSENTVKSRLHYGRRNLRKKAEALEKKGYVLYSIPPVVLLMQLMRMEAMALAGHLPEPDTASLLPAKESGTAYGMAEDVSGAAFSAAKKTGISSVLKVVLAVSFIAVLGAGGFVLTSRFSASSANDTEATESTDRQDKEQTPDTDNNKDTGTDWNPDTDDNREIIPRIFEDEEGISSSAAAEYSFTGTPAEGWGGLYSGYHQGRYSYVWLREYPEWVRESGALGEIRLLWEGDRPYEEGEPLLEDAPHVIYSGNTAYDFEIRPGWNGEASAVLSLDERTDSGTNGYSGAVYCSGIRLDREESLIFDGETLTNQP